MNDSVRDIKKAQKERLLLKEISQLLIKITLDDSRLQGMFPQKARLSEDKGICYIYFYNPEGKEAFDEKLEILKLYKPSLRTAIAKQIAGRYTPNLVFLFDDTYEKQERIHSILNKIKTEEEL